MRTDGDVGGGAKAGAGVVVWVRLRPAAGLSIPLMHVIHETHAPVLAGDVEVEGCDAEARADFRRDVGGEEGGVDAALRGEGELMSRVARRCAEAPAST